MNFGRRENIPVAELVGRFEQQMSPGVPPGNREPRFIEHIAGIAGPVGWAQSCAAAEKLDLSSEKRVGDLAGRNFPGQGWWPDFDRSGQLRTRREALEFVKPITEVPAELFNGPGTARDRASGEWPAETKVGGWFHVVILSKMSPRTA